MDLPTTPEIPRPARKVREVKVMTVRETAVPYGLLLNRADLIAANFADLVRDAVWFDPEKECMVALLLDRKNRLKALNLVTLGTATAALAHPREVFRAAVVASAAAVAVVHNHPSGDPAPSIQDVQVTNQLREAARTLDITLVDHVIIGRAEADPLGRGFYSFRSAGML